MLQVNLDSVELNSSSIAGLYLSIHVDLTCPQASLSMIQVNAKKLKKVFRGPKLVEICPFSFFCLGKKIVFQFFTRLRLTTSIIIDFMSYYLICFHFASCLQQKLTQLLLYEYIYIYTSLSKFYLGSVL